MTAYSTTVVLLCQVSVLELSSVVVLHCTDLRNSTIIVQDMQSVNIRYSEDCQQN